MSALVLVYNITVSGFTLVLPIQGGTITLIDWNDGTGTTNSHTYTNSGEYTVTVTGTGITNMNYNAGGSTGAIYLTSCTSFGEIGLTNLSYAFYNCQNLTSVPTSLPTSTVTNTSYMFINAYLFNQDLSDWDVSNVTDMSYMFYGAPLFNNGNAPLTWGEKTINVTTMASMFASNYPMSFNQDISGWNVSNVTNMANMFNANIGYPHPFNNGGVPLSWGTKTSKVENMSGMFTCNTSFNQDISGWDVSAVTTMNNMFNNASSFNQDLSDWDVSNVTDMSYMFSYATSFNNGDTSGSSTIPLSWGSSTSLVTTMNQMFRNATSFNQDINDWDISSVTTIIGMFFDASAFNRPLNSWVLSTTITNLTSLFQNASSFNQDLSSWDVSNVTNLTSLFQNASSFNQDLSSWDVSNVTNMNNMFSNTALSTANYNNILIDWSLLELESGVPSENLGLVYSPSGLSAHNTITSYNWDLTGDAYVSKDNLAKWTLFSLTINRVDLLGFVNGNEYQLYYSGITFSSIITYSSPATTITFTDLRFITSYSNSGNVSLVLKNNTSDTDIATYRFTVSGLVCFKEDTKILTNHGYIPIQHLRKGDLIQTLKDGFKPIYMIGKREIHHAAIEERIKDQLYVCTKENYHDIIDEDLVITGCHSILVKSFKDEAQKEKAANLQNGRIYVTDDHYRLPACLDDKSLVYEPAGIYTIYHLALEHDNYYMNYGIYANGLLVESCTKNYLERLSGMTLIE